MGSRFSQQELEAGITATLWLHSPESMRGNELVALTMYNFPLTSFREVLSAVWSACEKGLVVRTSEGWQTGIIKAGHEPHRN